MKIADYLQKYGNEQTIFKNNHSLKQITIDSRKVKRNAVYVAVKNAYANGELFIKDAIKKGAKTIVTENLIIDVPKNINIIFTKSPITVYANMLKFKYEAFPEPNLIGVTGTSGKTTVTTLVYRILKRSGYKCLLIGTSGYYGYNQIYESFKEASNTTPMLEEIYDLIYNNDFNYDYVIMEASSQGLSLGRLMGLKFCRVVFLNLNPEHLDYHHNMENYLLAKLKLFHQLTTEGYGIINAESSYKDKFIDECKPNCLTFGVNEGNYRIKVLDIKLDYMELEIEGKKVITELVGDFNASNIAAVYAIIKSLNINILDFFDVITSSALVSGRMQIIKNNKKTVVVDYAHTTKEVKKVLEHLQKYKIGKLIVVIGCGGNRDRSKRPEIGLITTEIADKVIFTEDNSRTEETTTIIRDIIEGVKKDNFKVILDREEAIYEGFKMLDDGDILAVIGKGIEKNIIGKKVKSFSDVDYAKKIIME